MRDAYQQEGPFQRTVYARETSIVNPQRWLCPKSEQGGMSVRIRRGTTLFQVVCEEVMSTTGGNGEVVVQICCSLHILPWPCTEL